MKEEGKYYTPEIEEFHIDFEYEYYNEYSNQWVEHICDLDDFGKDEMGPYDNESTVLPIESYEGRIRVKYLDQQDIKDLGWCFVKKIHSVPSLYTFQNKHFHLDVTFGNNRTLVKIYTECNYGDEYVFFRGYIKNKSELRKIMKQVGIIN